MVDERERLASDCIERLRLGTSSQQFGFKIQALAAHVLLRLGFRINAVNSSGHPDIVAIKDGSEFRFEVEAEVEDPRRRMLTEKDMASLLGRSDVSGYYALAISFPDPRWVLVAANKLVGRRPVPNMLLEALSDSDFSSMWTLEYINILSSSCSEIGRMSFHRLSERALRGRSL